jgi:hypothetical protein
MRSQAFTGATTRWFHAIGRKRCFFASSTDHTRLLRDSEVHRLPPTLETTDLSSNGTTTQAIIRYVMASSGMDTATVIKVPQLHLARLCVSVTVPAHAADDSNHSMSSTSLLSTGLNPTLFGAKVINRTLGSLDVVCGKLVESALSDLQPKSPVPPLAASVVRAKSTLHGLSDWVLEGFRAIQDMPNQDGSTLNQAPDLILSSRRNRIIYELSTSDRTNVFNLANGGATTRDKGVNGDGKSPAAASNEAWEQLAREYVEQKLSSEAVLYQTYGAVLESIALDADTSDFANTSGGSMAILRF